MREQLVVQTSAPSAVSVSSLTQAAGTATVTTASAHGYSSGDYVTIAGATPAGYNGTFPIAVTGASTFTYVVSAGLSSPATGTITATYVGDGKGNRAERWTTVATVWAEEIPLNSSERPQAGARQNYTQMAFRIYARADVSPGMRALWTPSWPASAAQRALYITGLLPWPESVAFQRLELADRAAAA